MIMLIAVILMILVITSRIWIFLSWLNSEYNDEEKDITDATSPEEYILRKIVRIFTKK